MKGLLQNSIAAATRLVWIDLEMTGLNVYTDKIIEIACIITDGNLNVVAEGPELVIHQEKDIMDSMDEWCTNQHGSSGLTAKVLNSTVSTKDAEDQVLEFIKRHVNEMGSGILAGNSVHMDKEFLRKEMPDLLGYLHYRLVDVSTVKALAQNWYPNLAMMSKAESHRALDDIRESIKELKYYRDKIFV